MNNYLMNNELVKKVMQYGNLGMYGMFKANIELLDSGYYDNMLKNIGLSMDYTEDDLDVMDDYFRNKRNIKISQEEFLSRIVFGVYIARIFENNNGYVSWKVLRDEEKILPEEDNRLLITVSNADMDFQLFPLVRLGRIINNRTEDSLSDWYSMAIVTGKFVNKNVILGKGV